MCDAETQLKDLQAKWAWLNDSYRQLEASRDELRRECERLRALIYCLSDGEECSFDHHGGCQTHGYLSLEPGERCPMDEANEIAARAAGGGEHE